MIAFLIINHNIYNIKSKGSQFIEHNNGTGKNYLLSL